MFIPHRVNITSLLTGQNELNIKFRSAYKISEAIREKRGHLLCWNGHYGRVYVRKAQYHYGWDWGPSLVTCGPWKPIYLEKYSGRIDDVKIQTSLHDDLCHATVCVEVDFEAKGASIEVEVKDPGGGALTASDKNSTQSIFEITNPKLWWPNDAGEQPLYTATIQLKRGDVVLDTLTKTFGVRKIELVQDKDNTGTTFYFRVNNVPIFAGGSNWIPGDSFLPRLTPERYQRWIDLARRAHHNIIRIWGGGIYEDDAFYDACDRAGLLVWQDFCFACGQYPADEQFRESVRQEAIAAVKRLRNHPSLALLAGNNEDYQIANEGLKHNMDMPEDQWLQSTFPARYTYQRLLPDVVTEHAPWITYWPGSPFGGIDNNSDRWFGDVHIWNVSSGMLVPYQRYPDLTARFVSEFGMLSCPHYKTAVDNFFGDSKDFHPQSEAFEFHCKASSYEKRIFTCMGEQFRLSFELKTYIFLTQLVQSEAMGFAFRGWRRAFANRHCGGAVVWQLNDCWPVTSWAIVDYFFRPKSAYYTIARAMKPLAVGVIRRYKYNPRPNKQHEALCDGRTKADAAPIIAHAVPHVYPPNESTYSVWVCNSQAQSNEVTVELRFISIATGKEVREAQRQTVEAKGTDTTEVFAGETPDEDTVLAARIFGKDGKILSRECDWPQPLKHLVFPERGLDVQQDGEQITVRADKPVKALTFQNPDVMWDDNCVDLMPGDEQQIVAKGLSDTVEWLYYGL